MTVRLRLWTEADRGLLDEANTAAMTAHLGGPETPEQVAARHAKYLAAARDGSSRPFAVLDDDDPVGWIGWWPSEHDGAVSAEAGWFTIPRAQGRGVASAALRLLIADAAASLPTGTVLTACPDRDNAPSNAVCARAGFRLVGTEDAPFRGAVLHLNVWALALPSAAS
jgi:RimJ/RimL family protein N-acetyltransferase